MLTRLLIIGCPTCGGSGQVLQGGQVSFTSALAESFDFSRRGVKPVGKGYAFFLKGFPGNKEEWSGLRRVLMEHGKVPGPVEITDVAGTPRLDVRGYIFDNGSGMLLGLLPDAAIPDPPGLEVRIKLDRDYHACDIRRRQYLGFGRTMTVGVTPPHAGLLTFLPERIEGLNVSPDKETGKPGDVTKLKGSLLPASLKDSRRVVRIEVSRDGIIQRGTHEERCFPGPLHAPHPTGLEPGAGYVPREGHGSDFRIHARSDVQCQGSCLKVNCHITQHERKLRI